MRAVRSERGFVTLAAVFWLLVIAVAVFLALKLLPSYISNYQLQDGVDTLAREATYSGMTEADIRKAIIRRAGELGIPLNDKQVIVKRDRAAVNIFVSYEVPVDLVARQVTLKLEASAGNRNIMVR